jgi:hypothetical protein
MKKELNIPVLLEKKHLYFSVTITPKDENGIITAIYSTKEKTPKGKYKTKTEKYKSLTGWGYLPEVSNDSVKHLGYTRYFHLSEKGFYINVYFND